MFVFGGSSVGSQAANGSNLFGGFARQQGQLQSTSSLFGPHAAVSHGSSMLCRSSGHNFTQTARGGVGNNGSFTFGQPVGSASIDSFGQQGQPQTTSSLFGPPAAGLFASSISGGSSGHCFGQPVNSSNPFLGSGSNGCFTFGQPAGSASIGSFGQQGQPQSTSSLFGPAAASLFASSNSGGSSGRCFGQPFGSANTGPFGQHGWPQSNSSLFAPNTAVSSTICESSGNSLAQSTRSSGSCVGSASNGSAPFFQFCSSVGIGCPSQQGQPHSSNSLLGPSASGSFGSNLFSGSIGSFGSLFTALGQESSRSLGLGQPQSTSTSLFATGSNTSCSNSIFAGTSRSNACGQPTSSMNFGLMGQGFNVGGDNQALHQPQFGFLANSQFGGAIADTRPLQQKSTTSCNLSSSSCQLQVPTKTSEPRTAGHGSFHDAASSFPALGDTGSCPSLMHLPPRPLLDAPTRSKPWRRLPQSAHRTFIPPQPQNVCAAIEPHSRDSSKRKFRSSRSRSIAIDPVALISAVRKRGAPEDEGKDETERGHCLGDEESPSGFSRSRTCKKHRANHDQDELFDVPTPLRENAVDNATKFSSTVAAIKPLFIRHDAEKLLQSEAQSKTRCAVVPSLAKRKYFTRPSIEEMCLMSENELVSIEDFEVCHEDFGSIKWPGCTDVRGMDLDKIVTIVDGRVSVYADSSPPVDTGLNKKAVISLRVKRHAECDVQATRLTERIQHLTVKAGHTFISYDLDTWIFSVPNFETSQS